jgi:hypothetical protein
VFTDLEFIWQIYTKNQSNKEVEAQKKKRRKINLDVDQCIDARWVLSKHVSEIKSLGLQKLLVVAIVGFPGVPSPSFTLLLIMVVVVLIVAAVQEYKKTKK